MTTTSSGALGFDAVQTSPSLKFDDSVPESPDNYSIDSIKSTGPHWIDQDRCSNRIAALNFAFMRINESTKTVSEESFKKLASGYLAFIETGFFE